MANRFWGETPIVQYKAPSLQETAWGPMQLKGQEDALRAQVDAMDEAKMTLEGALGEAAPKQEEFNKAYQEAIAGISQQGATPMMIEKAKKAKQLYAQHVLPMQDFAKKREDAIGTYAKLNIDGRSIVQGNPPSSVTFDQWKKDPNSLFSFKAVDKATLGKMAEGAGEAFGKSFTGVDESLVGKYGIMQWVEGAKSPADHAQRMATDEKYRTSWDRAKREVAAASGLDLSDPSVDAFITSNMESRAIGNVQPINMTRAQLDSLRGVGNKPQLGGGPGLVGAEPLSQFPEPEKDPISLALSGNHPGLKKVADDKLAQISGGKFTDIKDFNKELLIAEQDRPPEAMGNPYYGGTIRNPEKIHGSDYFKLKEYKDILTNELAQSPNLKSGITLDYNTYRMNAASVDNKMAKDIEEYKSILDDKLTNRFSQFKAANSSDQKFYNDIVKQKTQLKGIEFLGLQLRGGVERDELGGVNKVYGVGDYVINADVKYKSGSKDESRQVQLRVTPQDAMDVIRLFKKWNATTSDKTITDSVEKLITNYHGILNQ